MFNTGKGISKTMQDKFDAITETTFNRVYCEVMVTNDYKKFSDIAGNRSIKPRHLKNITESIAIKQIAVPIVVNERYQICDGQNRYEACIKLKKPIYYIVIDGLTLEDVQRLNANTHTWNTGDYLDSYCELGYEHYKKYKAYKRKYKFGHTECMIILNGWKNLEGKSINKTFNDGEFVIKDYSESIKISNKILKTGKYYAGYKRGGFVNAMLELFKNPEYNHNKFIDKLSRQSAKMTDQTNKKFYLIKIEEIYNHGCSSKNKVRLYAH